MASDDRPDDRRRFTLRRFLTPDDEPAAPADAATADDAGPDTAPDTPPADPEAFGTGGVDDDALDAIVQGAGPAALVWGTDEVPDPVPGDLPAADPLAEQRAPADEFVTAPPSAADADAASGEEDGDAVAPSAVEAAGARVLGALADAIGPDDLDPEPPAAEAADDDWAPAFDRAAFDADETPTAEANEADAFATTSEALPEDSAELDDADDEPVAVADVAEDPTAGSEPPPPPSDVAVPPEDDAPVPFPASSLTSTLPAEALPDESLDADASGSAEPAAADAFGDDMDEPDAIEPVVARPETVEPEVIEPEAVEPEPEPEPAETELPVAEADDAEPAVEALPPTVAALDPPTSEPLPPDPEPSFMETAEIDADLATADPTAAVDDAFEAQTDPAKRGGADGIEGDLEVTPLGPDDFAPEELRAVLRTMMLSRKLDEKMLTLLKQGKGFFHIGSAGHEASQTAVAREFEGGSDWFCFYYRDLATALTVGMEPADVLRAHFGKADDPFGGGRQMPEHFGHRGLNIMSTSSSVGAQYVPAVGFALACKREDGDGPRRAVYSSGGEGSTSQGAFHEALNWAAREALPVLFHVQDNKYAISVPVEEQTAGGSIWHLLGGYAGLRRIRYDGTDFFQSAAAAKAAMDHIRGGHGPVALHADLVRLLPHSSSDDHKKYREAASLEADAARDPIPRLAAQLVEAGVMTDADVEALRAEVSAEIDRLAKEVEKEADPDASTATAHVYYEGPDDRAYEADGPEGDLIVMVDAINHALDEEMARDEKVLVYGEDVGGGKGGVFTATRGLTAKHGRDRCFNSPLAEHSILGSAVGLAAAGYKPVVEIQFADYIWPGMQQLRNQIASMRYRSNGAWACPMVVRVPAGGYIHGGLCHSQNVEAIFGHFPGLHVVMPSNAADAKGLLKTAIRGNDPVLFLEHKALYRQGPARRPEPHDEYLVPLGKAAIAREGTDLTIVTWGAIVYKALAAAKALEKEGVSVEVVDVRSFLPYDAETVLASVKKTGRVLVAYEDHEFMGFGAEIAAQVADGAFGHLDAPVKRVAGAFSSIPYADPLEKAVLPQDADVLGAAREVLAY